jgi:septum formation protein
VHNMFPTLILASQSAQRRLLMESLGLSLKIIPSHFDEDAIAEADPARRVLVLAQHKAETIAQLTSEPAIIIAADSVVTHNGKLYEKPTSPEQAAEWLNLFSGKKLEGYTSLVIRPVNITEYSPLEKVSMTEAQFNSYTPEHVAHYVTTQPVTTWSGGFSQAYPAGATMLESVQGSYTAFVYGLDMALVTEWLRSAGAWSR